MAQALRYVGPLLVIGIPLLSGRALAQTAPAAPNPHAHALLIGCTDYPELGAHYQLRGPANDVALTARLLHDRFGIAESDIVRLVHANDESGRPTLDNIIREFNALVGRVGSGDNVFILISGHGSQLKDDNPNDPNDNEYDGLDEVFLPEDVAKWKPGAPIPKAIRDDQFREWLDALRARGAFVFFVADTCHAGTMNKGQGDEEEEADDEGVFFHERTVDPSLISPPDAFDNLPVRPPQSEAEEPIEEVTDFDAATREGPGGLIALFAVDETSLEKEHAMPPDNKADGPHYGRLTYALNAVLAGAKRPLTYRELAQQLRWRYQSWFWDGLGYMAGGAAELDREVLGEGSWRNRSAVTLSRDDIGRLSIDAGVLNGASVGSIYGVYPPVGTRGDAAPAGWVQVTAATPTSSQVTPCAFKGGGLIPSEQLPAPGRCELAYAARDSLKMSIDVSPWEREVDEELFARVVKRVLKLIAADGALFRLYDDDEVPDAAVLLRDDGLYLRHTFDAVDEGANEFEGRFPDESYGPFPATGDDDAKLGKALQAMAKAANLRRIATVESDEPAKPDGLAVTVGLTVERKDAGSSAFQAVDLMWPLKVKKGDALRVSVVNRGRVSADVTILHIDSANHIRSVYPTRAQAQQGFNNRILPKGVAAVVEISIDEDTIGPEDVLVIATAPVDNAPPSNFAFVEQAALKPEQMRGVPTSALNTPAGRLIAAAAFGQGKVGGSAAADLSTFAVRRVSWNKRLRTPVTP